MSLLLKTSADQTMRSIGRGRHVCTYILQDGVPAAYFDQIMSSGLLKHLERGSIVRQCM